MTTTSADSGSFAAGRYPTTLAVVSLTRRSSAWSAAEAPAMGKVMGRFVAAIESWIARRSWPWAFSSGSMNALRTDTAGMPEWSGTRSYESLSGSSVSLSFGPVIRMIPAAPFSRARRALFRRAVCRVKSLWGSVPFGAEPQDRRRSCPSRPVRRSRRTPCRYRQPVAGEHELSARGRRAGEPQREDIVAPLDGSQIRPRHPCLRVSGGCRRRLRRARRTRTSADRSTHRRGQDAVRGELFRRYTRPPCRSRAARQPRPSSSSEAR